MKTFRPYIVKKGFSVERKNKFIRENSVEYRRSVIKVFLKTIKELKGSELGRPKRILEEMATFSEEVHSELEERYTNKLDNLKRGNSACLDDPEFFELIEAFVWKHKPESIKSLRIMFVLERLGATLSNFLYASEFDKEIAIKYESGLEHLPDYIPEPKGQSLQENEIYRATYLTTFDNEKITWSELASRNNIKTDRFQDKVDSSYFVVKKLDDYPFDLVISFNAFSRTDIHYGLHLPNRNMILIKSFRSSFPIFIDYSISVRSTRDNISSSQPKSHSVIKNYFEPLENCLDDSRFSNSVEIALAKQRAKEILTNFGF